MKLVKNVFIPLLFIVSIHLSFQLKYFFDFPNHIHAWTQSDRYALALGFVENDLDLFHPQTYYLNPTKAQPNLKRDSGITAVDFPLPDYFSAVIMKISGSNSPFIFRSIVFAFFILGIYFLFLLIKAITSSYWKGIVYSSLFSLSPVLVYYSNGFIPSIPALSLSIVALYFAYKHFILPKKSFIALALVFFTLAAMMRATFILPLGSYLIWLFITNKPIELIKRYFVVFLIPTLFLLYRFYNSYLITKYGSIFLGSFLPPLTYQDFKDILKLALHNWAFDYFSIPQYLFLIAALTFLVLSKNKSKLVIFAIINTFFAILFSLLLFKQFPAHDYYFIDLWMIPILTWLITALIAMEKLMIEKEIIFALSFPLAILSMNSIQQNQLKRRDTGSWDQNAIQTHQFEKSKAFFNALKMKNDDKVLVLGATTTNIPLIKINQKGYTVIHTSKENIEQALDWNWDFVIIPNVMLFSDILKNDPSITAQLEWYKSNEYFSVFIRKTESSRMFLPYEEITSYEYNPSPLKLGDSCQIKFIETSEFIGTVELPKEQLKSNLLLIEIRLIDEIDNIELVFSSDGNSLYNRAAFPVKNNFNDSFFQLVPLNDLLENATTIKAYIYNPTKTFVEFDRFTIKEIKLNE